MRLLISGVSAFALARCLTARSYDDTNPEKEEKEFFEGIACVLLC
jgi:hypothetical protein